MSDCGFKVRHDDIPKLRRWERTWECERCGVIQFAVFRPDCRRKETDELERKIDEHQEHTP